jgi:hypothetical protein
VAKEPRGFHAATEHPLNLPGRDAFLAGAHEMDDLQPKPQRQMGRLEDGPHSHGKGLAALVALVEARTGGLTLELAHAPPLAAVGAHGAIRPKPGFDVFEGGFLAMEMGLGKKGLGHDNFLWPPL